MTAPPAFDNPYQAEIILGACEYSWSFNEAPGYFGGQGGHPIILMKEMEPVFGIRFTNVENLITFEESIGGKCGGALSG